MTQRDLQQEVKATYPDAHIRKTSDKHFAVFAEGKRLGGYSLLEENAWCYARIDPLFQPSWPPQTRRRRNDDKAIGISTNGSTRYLFCACRKEWALRFRSI